MVGGTDAYATRSYCALLAHDCPASRTGPQTLCDPCAAPRLLIFGGQTADVCQLNDVQVRLQAALSLVPGCCGSSFA